MVTFNLRNKAKRNRQYPEPKVGDEVRVRLKKDSKQKDMCQNGQHTNIR